MQPYGTKGTQDNPNPNVLTIDVPQAWENTYCPPHKTCPSIVGPEILGAYRLPVRHHFEPGPVRNRELRGSV